MKPFTVIGSYPDNGQIYCGHVMAKDTSHAFWVASHKIDYEVEFIACVPGHLSECDDQIAFPGDGVVSSETILDQPEVFCS